MHVPDVAIIGAGAAGIACAISAGRTGMKTILCDRMAQAGRKILASGNGRCNIFNEDLSEECYNSRSRPLVKSVFSRFGRKDIGEFFGSLGLAIYSDCGRIFPATNQSASVLKVLEIELARLSIPVVNVFEAASIEKRRGVFTVTSNSGKKITASSIVIATGGRTYPALGSNGSGYTLAERLGHTLVAPVPAAVPLVVKDGMCHILQGQKISVKVNALVGREVVSEAAGDLLFTKYGLSGTSILDISEEVSIAINRDHRKDVSVIVDMVPFMERDGLQAELKARIDKKMSPQDIIAGILPNKFGTALGAVLKSCKAGDIADHLKNRVFNVLGTRGWNEADFTAGGINTTEIDNMTLESKVEKGLYFAGEVLDVNGKRGGYNLAWAWASGFVAGAGQ